MYYAIDASTRHPGPVWPLVGKWFVFWSAGLRQMLQPRYTAEKILGLKGCASRIATSSRRPR